MKRTLTALAGLAFAAVLSAQGDAAKVPPSGLDALTAEWKAATKAFSDASKALQATEEYKAAAAAKNREKITELMGTLKRPDAKAFGQKVLAYADTQKGDAAIKALAFATSLGETEVGKSAVERIRKDFLDSPAIVPVMENGAMLARYVGNDGANSLLDDVIAKNQDKEAKAWAMYWKASMVQRDKNASDEAKAAADTLMTDAAKLVPGSLLADRIAAPTFEKENLQIGMVAPDIAGEDVDGVAFKLSDYRGKVVVLDFWGFW